MTNHWQEDNALDALLRVADVRTERALQGALRLSSGLASILTADAKTKNDEIPMAMTGSEGDQLTSSTATVGDCHSQGLLALLDRTSTATALRTEEKDPRLSDADLRLLSQIASGVTADVAARKLELSARTLRRQLRTICNRLEVNTPIEAVVWAARKGLI
jgi:DNA-binding NarL/FixJ family response regulator